MGRMGQTSLFGQSANFSLSCSKLIASPGTCMVNILTRGSTILMTNGKISYLDLVRLYIPHFEDLMVFLAHKIGLVARLLR